MKLKVMPRSVEKKRESKRLRRQGSIPAVLYGRNIEADNISVSEQEFNKALRHTPKGRLATTVFTLVDEKGKERSAIVKDIQYHPTSYEIVHLDFEELQKDVKVKIKIPIEFSGEVDCVGVKQGGVLRQVIRSVRVSCLPKDIPTTFMIDVKNLGMRQYKKLSDIKMPETITPLTGLDEVVVVIAKR